MTTREATRQYRLSKWAEIIRDCRNSGQTISAWCAANNVNIKKYYYWLRLLRESACESMPALSSSSQQFVPLKMPADLVKSEQATTTSSSHITLRVNLVTVKINNGASTTENNLRAIANVR